MMRRTLFILLLFAFCSHFVRVECRKKKKSKFSFDSLLSGLDGEEKEMFKEELEKEVKKFRKLLNDICNVFCYFIQPASISYLANMYLCLQILNSAIYLFAWKRDWLNRK